MVKQIGLKIFILLFSLVGSRAYAQNLASCSSYAYTRSSAEHRSELLTELKASLLTESQEAAASLSQARRFIDTCTDEACNQFRTNFYAVLVDQVRTAKMARAIAERGPGLFAYLRAPRTLVEFIQRKERGTLRPENVARFEVPGFTFSEQEKQETLEIWYHIFIRTAGRMGVTTNVRDIYMETQRYFRLRNQELIEMNPLLAFVSEDILHNPRQLSQAFNRMINYNEQFLRRIEQFETSHSTSVGSYATIWINDHEMGLVNFSGQADRLLSTLEDQSDIDVMCSAWHDLKRQQTRRVVTSIGVGLGTAIVCGVGSLSGIGTAGAAVLCLPALADGSLGAWRGRADSNLSYNGFFAGREIDLNGDFSHGLLTYENSSVLDHRGDVVFLVNLLGLIPVGRAVQAAHAVESLRNAGTAVARPQLYQFFALPASDMSVSGVEVNAANISYLLLLVRNFEFFAVDFSQELEALRVNAPQ